MKDFKVRKSNAWLFSSVALLSLLNPQATHADDNQAIDQTTTNKILDESDTAY